MLTHDTIKKAQALGLGETCARPEPFFISDQDWVELILTKGARAPKWLLLQTRYVTIKINSVLVRSLQIIGGQASFFPGGMVGVNTKAMKKTDECVIAFNPGRVIMIRDLEGNILKQNMYACLSCMDISGKTTDQQPGTICGKTTSIIECQHCKQQ